MNTKLLRKVQKHILEVPERLDMNWLVIKVDPTLKGAPACGTAGCIAGWSHLLTLPKLPVTETQFYAAGRHAWKNAKKKLALTSEQAFRLFKEPKYWEEGVEGWPKKFAIRYVNAKTPQQRAKVTAERIDHFIATRGKE